MKTSTFFLWGKHWQVLIVVIVLLYGGQLDLVMSQLNPHPSQESIARSLLLGLLAALSLTGALAWFCSLGSFLNSICRPELKMRRRFFHFALVYPMIYSVFFTFIVTFENAKTLSPSFIVPLHILVMGCLLYLMHFVSKSLKLAETREPVIFKNYWIEFFLVWFFPLGIWIIQPRVNHLYAQHRSAVR